MKSTTTIRTASSMVPSVGKRRNGSVRSIVPSFLKMALIVSSIMLILHADSTASLILQKNGVSMMLFNWNLERRAWSQQHSRTGGRPELQQQSRQQRRRHGSSTGLQMMEELICDVAIVGGGPAGCTCALYTSRADLKTIILDKNPAVGALAITSHIANYPGVDRSMSGAELLEQMKVQAIQYGTEYYDRAQVFLIDIEDEGDGSNSNELHNKVVYTPDYKVKARALVLATGAMGRSLPFLPGEEEFLGSGVSYCATCDGAFYRGSEVAVYGATREAMDEALFLTKFASTVHWITPTDVLSCLERNKIMKKVECNANFDEEGYQALTAQPNVKHWNKARILNVLGDASGVTGVTIKGILGEDGEQQEQVIPVEGAFIYGAGGGSKPITEFCQGKVELDESGGVVVDRDTLETSVKGVFAIGDIRNTAYKQVVVAAADGCIAAMSIEKFLKGRNRVKVDWIHK